MARGHLQDVDSGRNADTGTTRGVGMAALLQYEQQQSSVLGQGMCRPLLKRRLVFRSYPITDCRVFANRARAPI